MSDTTVKLDGLEIHELAMVFPAYGGEDFEKLTNDIRNYGVRQPITLFEGKVLDGRNRYDAAREAGKTTIPAIYFEGPYEEARNYVISLNLIRRHLDTGQRAMIVADLAKMPQGTRTDINLGQNCPMSNEQAAKALKVSPMSVKTAKAVKRADPALAEQVKQGKVTLAEADRTVKGKRSVKNLQPRSASSKKSKATSTETKRHDERMKSARYKLEAFVKDYGDMDEWKVLRQYIKEELSIIDERAAETTH
jgi:ParB-like chromosome segregation protein Spo0J